MRISQKYFCPVVGSGISANGSANNAPIARPNTIPAPRLFTFLANHPIRMPATRPLPIDPITIPAIWGATSGAETSAVRPSKIPSTPPATSPSTGLFIPHSWLWTHTSGAPSVLIRQSRVSSLNAAPPQNEQPDHHVREKQQNQRAVPSIEAQGFLPHRFRVRRH